jgi:hypothetical protein
MTVKLPARSTFFFLCWLAACCIHVPLASAQDCSVIPELIFEMSTPKTGSYNIWDTVFGEADRQEIFRAAVPLADGHLLAAGESYVFAGGDVELLLTRMDQRGRVIWHKNHQIPGLKRVKGIVKIKDGYMVLGDRSPAKAEAAGASKTALWLGLFDDAGFLKSEVPIEQPGASLLAEDIIPLKSSGRFMIAATLVPDSAAAHGGVFVVNEAGRVLSERAFSPGLENAINGLTLDKKGHVYAGGFIRAENGRRMGWALKLNADGTLIWQQQYPRGRTAILNKVAPYKNNALVAAGRAFPGTGGHSAGWVMLLDATTGKPIWQRYYTDALNQDARDILVGEGELFSVLLSGEKIKKNSAKKKSKAKEFVRILSITSTGNLFLSDEYFNASGVQGNRLVQAQSGMRMVIGSTLNVHIDTAAITAENNQGLYGPANPNQAPLKQKPKDDLKSKSADETPKVYSLDGWVLAGAAAEPYDDPCIVTAAPEARAPSDVPDDE